MNLVFLLLLLLLLVTTCAASPQDLSGKMFTFPQMTSTAHVRLNSSIQDFPSLTVCHRSFTDLKRDHTLFSFSTPSSQNTVLIIWNKANNELQPHIKDKRVEYRGLDDKPNMWHSICTTWSAADGLVQVWFDGRPTFRKYTITGSSITGANLIIIGQEQDTHGGGFEINQSFVGMMTDLHMWDYVLSPCEIHKYTNELNFTPGNALNWGALEFQIFNRVLVEDKQVPCV